MDQTLLVGARVRVASKLRERIVVTDDGSLEGTDSAFSALTDFEWDFPITVDLHRPIDEAREDMNRLGIHALLVTKAGLRGVDPQVEGLVTAHEIERGLPRARGRPGRGTYPSGLLVRDVMTPWDQLSFVNYSSLGSLTALDLLERFQGTGLSHLLVVEMRGEELAVARGVLSRATLAKRLGRWRGAPAR